MTSVGSGAVEYCGNGFCTSHAEEVARACHEFNFPPGHHILFATPEGYCYCVCGRALGVPVQTSIAITDGQLPLDAVVENRTHVLAAGTGLRFEERAVTYKTAPRQVRLRDAVAISYRVWGAQHVLVMASTRPVLLYDGRTLCPAGRLQLADRLCDATGAPVEIDDLRIGSFVGPYVDVAVSLDPPNQDYDGHLLVLSEVVVGDVICELYPVTGVDVRPVVGSVAWRAACGRAVPVAPEPAIDLAGGVFKPASAHRISIPSHASD